MAESDALAKEFKSFRTVVFGTCLIIWILAIFIILTFYKFNDRLNDIQQNLQFSLGQVSTNSMSNFQVVDPDHKVIYLIEQKPMPEPDGLMPGMPGGSMVPMPGMPPRPHKVKPESTVPPAAPAAPAPAPAAPAPAPAK